ncbi:uroporphyrinogen-III synthase [Mesonia aquimarina]|uniref:uroporphyrinogen-III synthase n=1 Tax=Mesonia aquimarina TaxID=1504967 RepID=UPI000EF5D949|nr:uroporphyrinogen-III synthase [Mesonia aquimarina]
MSTILSSKILEQNQFSLLLNANINIVQYNAIHIHFHQNLDMPTQVENAIITSKNAFKAIQNKVEIKQAFVVGNKTAELLKNAEISIAEKADYGKNLADIICKNHAEKNFHFFCGNKRRNEIPNILRENKITFIETEVYKTTLNPKKFKQEFDGVLFYSPSGVQSFVQQNKLKNTTAFCIGKTTASEAKKHTENIIIANQPTVENLIVQVVKKYRND